MWSRWQCCADKDDTKSDLSCNTLRERTLSYNTFTDLRQWTTPASAKDLVCANSYLLFEENVSLCSSPAWK